MGNVLTFTEAPESSDMIDARILTTTSSITSIGNDSGNARVEVSLTSPDVLITGNLLPAANLTYNIGSPTAYWNDAYFAGNTIYLGPLQLKAISPVQFGVFQADGVTPADLDVGNIDVAAITQGNSVIGIESINGNAYITIDGVENVLQVTPLGADVIGAINASGNITGSYILGNGSQLTGIDATSIQNGTANVRTFENANVTVSADGNANVGVFTGNGLVVTGSIEATNGFIGLDATSIANGTANVRTFENGNVTISAAGTVNVLTVTGTGVNITGTLDVTGNANVGNIDATNVVATNLTGTLQTAAQTNITSVGTLTSLDVTGNVTAGNLTVNGIESVGTLTINNDATIIGNLTVQGNTITANVTSLVISDPIINLGRGANNTPLISNDGLDRGVEMFYFTTAEQIAFMGYDNNAGRMIIASNVDVSNNVVTVNSYGITEVGTLEAAVANIAGNVAAGNLSGTNIAGTLTTAAQPNITSVGNLTSLTVSGNTTSTMLQEKITAVGNVSAGSYNIDTTLSNIFDITLTGNVTFTFTNPPPLGFSKNVTVILRQDAVGNRAATFTGALYTEGQLPQLSTGANQIDVLTFFTPNGGSSWFGTFAMAAVS